MTKAACAYEYRDDSRCDRETMADTGACYLHQPPHYGLDFNLDGTRVKWPVPGKSTLVSRG